MTGVQTCALPILLARCLESVSGLVDEIVVVDTGSTDRTREIAERFTGRVYDFIWINDFAAARNYGRGACEAYPLSQGDAELC